MKFILTRVKLEERTCLVCGNSFQPQRSHARFCSRKCIGKQQKRNKNVVKKYKDKIRHGGEKQKLIDKNGLVCSKCGKEGLSREIVAHHVTFNNKDHANQVLLCQSCHCRLHHSFPKKDISREQIVYALDNSKTIVEAQILLGISKETFYRKRKEHGFNLGNRSNEKYISKEQVLMAIKSTSTVREAAKFLGINVTTFYVKKKKYGLV